LEQRQKEIEAKLENSDTHGGELVSLNRELVENTEKLERLNQQWHAVLERVN